MKARSIRAGVGWVVFSVLAQAQDRPVERAFTFSQINTDRDKAEVAAVIRGMGDGLRVEVDSSGRLAVNGKPDQVQMAEWMETLLDRPAVQLGAQATSLTPGEFRFGTGNENTVRVIFLTWARTPQELAEVSTIIRSLGDMRRVFTYGRLNAVAIRGTAEQVALADWLAGAMRRTGPVSDAREYRLNGTNEPMVAVADLSFARSPQELAEASTLVRSIVDIRRVFTFNGGMKVGMRGTAEQVKLANWLFQQMASRPGARAVVYEAGVPDALGNAVKAEAVEDRLTLFYAPASQDMAQLREEVRAATQARRVFTFTPQAILAVRGNATQVAAADRFLKERGY